MEEKTIDKIDLDEDSEEEETIQLWMPRGIIHNSTLCGGAQKKLLSLEIPSVGQPVSFQVREEPFVPGKYYKNTYG